ncbi:MAG: 30S ribosomal protein S20 [Oscillospiraceae bacterium]|nr:30S ribosomal protein S20 [Oscillospiraceae bacterium]MBQ8918015.1 30S ribosomal protein S20 [Oscillospiraceae bacterium]MBQ9109248.1 30S ribosomal protein S20 [Oscillospiraceae bacterium]
MPNIKSAKKRVKVIEAKTLRNKAIKSNLKTTLKKANLAIENQEENSVEAVRLATKKIDQAVAKGILHKNTAARKKSQLAVKAAAANK